jgi:hypothetical protein
MKKVLSHVFLEAVFTSFEILAQEDPESTALIAGKNATIIFVAGIGGPKATITIRNSRIKVEPGKVGNPDIIMFFPIARWMTNMLSKKRFRNSDSPDNALKSSKGLRAFDVHQARRMKH